MKMECKFCKNTFSTKQNLNNHQRTAKYCLRIQGKEPQYKNECKKCGKKFRQKIDLKRHMLSCKSNSKKKILEDKKIIEELKIRVNTLETENKMLKNQLSAYREDFNKLSITAVKRPTNTTSNKTIQINNYIKQMEPLRIDRIKENVPMLTLDHHVKGPEGYAEYALEFPFKDRIVCVDVSRNKIKYKNEEGDIIEDPGFRKMMMKLCDALKDRSYKLCQEHYEKLLDKFSEEEMDNTDFDFMEAAKAIHKYANGRESDFCSKIIRLISRGSKVVNNSSSNSSVNLLEGGDMIDFVIED
jgi:hypothetical protein